MQEASWLLVHSPLVGPSSWRPVDDEARARGVDVIRPDLTSVGDAPAPRWEHFVDSAVRATDGRSDLVVVGHSGAGAMLPAIGARMGDRLRALVFVDSVVPPPRGAHTTSERLRGSLDEKIANGRLLQWLDWWPDDVVAELVPGPEGRSELRSDMPRLPRSFYDEDVPVPLEWSTGPCAYLRLSSAYDEELDAAGRIGWPCAAIDGTHLSIFTDPSSVLDGIEALLTRLDRNSH